MMVTTAEKAGTAAVIEKIEDLALNYSLCLVVPVIVAMVNRGSKHLLAIDWRMTEKTTQM